VTDRFRGMLTYEGSDGEIQAYQARPQTEEPRPAVIVIHEIYGLTDHTRDIANRFAQEGYVAFAPHLFSRPELAEDMTPDNIRQAMQFNLSLPRERIGDSAFIQEELAKLPPESRAVVQRVGPLLMGGLPRDKMIQDLIKAVQYLEERRFVQSGKVASVGFCFGGGMSINLACHAHLAASVVFYGDNPNPIEKVQDIPCPVLGLYGADDLRINRSLDALVKAMVDYKKDFEMRIYPNAAHAFFNDTNPNTYRKTAARDAWERVLNFYKRALAD
jgi:carboxymethylenebutenolidase